MDDIRKKVKHIRRDYDMHTLLEENSPDEPLALFRNWLEDAIESGQKEPNAFVLSTAVKGEVDSRVVLLRDFDEDGIQFFTNYGSNKGGEIDENPQVAINFFWSALDRQLRIRAKVEKLDEKLSDEYFASRPRESRIGAWASQQSSQLENREHLEKEVERYRKEFEGKEVPRPEFWGGYLAKPDYFEFWQGRESRLHDRIVYEAENQGWKKYRLYP